MGKIQKYCYLCCKNSEKKMVKQKLKSIKKSPYIIIDDIGQCDTMLIVGPVCKEMEPDIKFAQTKSIAMEYIAKEKLDETIRDLQLGKGHKRALEYDL